MASIVVLFGFVWNDSPRGCVHVCLCVCVRACEKEERERIRARFRAVFSIHFLRAYHQTMDIDDPGSREEGKVGTGLVYLASSLPLSPCLINDQWAPCLINDQ